MMVPLSALGEIIILHDALNINKNNNLINAFKSFRCPHMKFVFTVMAKNSSSVYFTLAVSVKLHVYCFHGNISFS